jgi:uncharacterized protein (DUF1015 family)
VPEISAFQALHYNSHRFTRDISALVAPPYDVLSAEDKAGLLRQNEHNIVAVDLPHVPPKTAGPDEVYARAAKLLQQWIADQALIADPQPAIYVYHQRYQHGGQTFTRKKFFARLRLEAFGTGSVFPHEQTFGGPKEDRLKLMQATRCQLSAVFGLYSDPSNSVSGLLAVEQQEPDLTAKMEDVHNYLWTVHDKAIIDAVASSLAHRAVYIADGHHRYGTALTYRDWLTAQTGPLTFEHPAQFVLVGFCAMEDPGCVILPTHRVLVGVGDQGSAIRDSWSEGLRLTPAADTDPSKLITLNSPHDLAIYVAREDRYYTATFTNRQVLDSLAPERTAPWRKLDLAYLHQYLIDELVTRKVLSGAAPTIHYIKDAAEAIADARATNGIALLCKPCTMAELRAVSEAGDLMPQKSTYFYPKLATGFVINPLE